MESLKLTLSDRRGMWFGVLMAGEKHLAASAFSERKQQLKAHLFQFSRRISGRDPQGGSSRLVYEVADLFDGKRSHGRFAFKITQLTSFQEGVHRILMTIPKGRVTTYGHIASHLTSGPRAVGNAVGSNPWPLFVPCHRVVPSSRLVGQYSMNGVPSRASSLVKQGLLEREGVKFIDKRVTSATIWHP